MDWKGVILSWDTASYIRADRAIIPLTRSDNAMLSVRAITAPIKEANMAKNSKGQAKKPKQEKPKTNASTSTPSLKGFAATTSGAGTKK